MTLTSFSTAKPLMDRKGMNSEAFFVASIAHNFELNFMCPIPFESSSKLFAAALELF